MIRKHTHQFNTEGVCVICSQTEKVYKNAHAEDLLHGQATSSKDGAHTHNHEEEHDHEHSHEMEGSWFRLFQPAIFSLLLLLAALSIDHLWKAAWFSGWIRLIWYVIAYIPVGFPVLKDAWKSILKGNFFSEFFLMGLATIGAFAIGEYPEGVAVMLFYALGEAFQSMAVSKAKANIKSLLDQRPDEATVIQDGKPIRMKAMEIPIGAVIQLKPGEKLGLDGVLLTDQASFNTAALTGESKPDTKSKGDTVLAGMINLKTLAEVEVQTVYADSKLSKILELVQHASSQKAPTELFISKFAKIYTPIVVFLAIAIAFLPFFFVADYHFQTWLYRALIFLVVSCPCALVISIPLGYFGGIGAASRKGILVKGGNFLDSLAGVKDLVMDKTGTMTEGVFEVQEVVMEPAFEREEVLAAVNLLESKSSHPAATAIHQYVGEPDHQLGLTDAEEIPGHGLFGKLNGKEYLVGNVKLLDKFQVSYPEKLKDLLYTTICIAVDKEFAGYITIADRIKEGAADAVKQLHKLQVRVTMLSGDKDAVVQQVAKELGIDRAYGDLLPEDKVAKLKELKNSETIIGFVGDGVNDAPVVAISDVGIAMGGLGSDATVEIADVVIQDDQPVKIPMAIRIGKRTKQIVWQNITLAFAVKAIVLLLGAGGLATMWEAVFADVGVALLAILNAVRIQRTKNF